MPYSNSHKSKSHARILESASELFCRYGFDQVSIGRIMAAARMTHGAFYSHFESKEALYKAAFLRTMEYCSASRLAKAPFSLDRMVKLAKNLLNLRIFVDQPAPENILFNEIGNSSQEIKHVYEQAYLNVLKMLETRVTALRKMNENFRGEKDKDVSQISRAILATLVGAIVISKSIEKEDEIQKILLAAQTQILLQLGVANEVQSLG